MGTITRLLSTVGCLLVLCGCGGEPSTRVQLVADACQFDVDEVPDEAQWVVRDYETPLLEIDFPDDGRAVEIETSQGTTLEQVDKNLRINFITCYEDDGNEEEDRLTDVTWSPDAETYTLDSEKIYDADDLAELHQSSPPTPSSASDSASLEAPGTAGRLRSFGEGAMPLELTEAEYAGYMRRLNLTGEQVNDYRSYAMANCQDTMRAEDYAYEIALGIGTDFEDIQLMATSLGVRRYCSEDIGAFAAGSATLTTALGNLDGYCTYKDGAVLTDDGQTFDDMEGVICG